MSTPANPPNRPLRIRRAGTVAALPADDENQLPATEPTAARPSSTAEALPSNGEGQSGAPTPGRAGRNRRSAVVEAVPTDEVGRPLIEAVKKPAPRSNAPAVARPQARPRLLPHVRIAWLDAILARPDLLLLAAIVFLAFAIRLFNLGNFPDNFTADEADNTEDALRIIHGMPPENGFFGFDWKPQPAYSAYLLSFFLRIFGVSIFAARLPSALISTLALIPFYFLLRRQFSVIAALLGTVLLATNLWYLNFSRSVWENVHICFYMLITMLFLLFALDGLRKKSTPQWWVWFCFAATGFFCALGLYGYFGGRAIVLAVIAYFPIALWFYHRRWGRLLAGYIVIGAVTAILIWPQVAYTIRPDKWTFFNQRSNVVLLLNTDQYKANPVGTIMEQIGRNIRGLWFGDVNHMARYTPDGQPLLDTITGLLVFVGFILSLALARTRRRPETYLWWLMLIIPWAFTEVITTSTPDGARGVGWMPTLIYFATITIEAIVLFSARLRNRRWLPVAATVAAVLIVAFINVNNYVYWQSLDGTRGVRFPYIANCEFPAWSAQVIDRAETQQRGFAVTDWLVDHPRPQGVQVLPCGPGAQAASQPAASGGSTSGSGNPPPAGNFNPPTTARQQWPPLLATIAKAAPAGQGQLSEPRAVAVDKQGNIYVVDTAANAQSITKYDRNGKFLLAWGGKGGPNDNDKFESIWALGVDKAGEVLALDETDYWVHVFDGNGKFLRKWGGPDSRMYHPRAMSIDANDNVYIADTGGKRILLYTASGQLQKEMANKAAGIAEAQQVVEPGGVAAAQGGGFFVGDSGAQLIRRYDSVGQQQNSWTFAQVDAVSGPRLAVAPDGSLYATAPPLCAIIHYDAEGVAKDAAGNCDSRDYLDQPSGLTIADGKLYVTDLGQRAVQVFSLPTTSPAATPATSAPAATAPVSATTTLTSPNK